MKPAAVLLGSALLALLFSLPFLSYGQKEGASFFRSTVGEHHIQSASLAQDPGEKRILAVMADMAQNQGGYANVPPGDGRLLRVLTEAKGARQVVEIGTSNGFSGLWFCLALRKTGGRLTTFEIDPQRVALARKNFARAGVAHLVTVVQGDAHQQVKKLKGPIDVLFLDADKPGYIDYLNKLLPLVRPGGLILAHNMNWPRPDPRFVKAITTNPALESLFLHMNDAGMAVVLKKR